MTNSQAPDQGERLPRFTATARPIVRFNQMSDGFRLVDHIEDQSPITEGSVVLLSDGRRYLVHRVVNPPHVTYSIAYVEPYGEVRINTDVDSTAMLAKLDDLQQGQS